MVGTLAESFRNLAIVAAGGLIFHCVFRISISCFEPFAMNFLRLAPSDVGHIGAHDESAVWELLVLIVERLSPPFGHLPQMRPEKRQANLREQTSATLWHVSNYDRKNTGGI